MSKFAKLIHSMPPDTSTSTCPVCGNDVSLVDEDHIVMSDSTGVVCGCCLNTVDIELNRSIETIMKDLNFTKDQAITILLNRLEDM